ncbi:hypothetical protein J6590_004736 [Homalodisca vitripennis]|nr:hypothetical protein J6590_004736 [Homalodisca vitripennis]
MRCACAVRPPRAASPPAPHPPRRDLCSARRAASVETETRRVISRAHAPQPDARLPPYCLSIPRSSLEQCRSYRNTYMKPSLNYNPDTLQPDARLPSYCLSTPRSSL